MKKFKIRGKKSFFSLMHLASHNLYLIQNKQNKQKKTPSTTFYFIKKKKRGWGQWSQSKIWETTKIYVYNNDERKNTVRIYWIFLKKSILLPRKYQLYRYLLRVYLQYKTFNKLFLHVTCVNVLNLKPDFYMLPFLGTIYIILRDKK